MPSTSDAVRHLAQWERVNGGWDVWVADDGCDLLCLDLRRRKRCGRGAPANGRALRLRPGLDRGASGEPRLASPARAAVCRTGRVPPRRKMALYSLTERGRTRHCRGLG